MTSVMSGEVGPMTLCKIWVSNDIEDEFYGETNLTGEPVSRPASSVTLSIRRI